MTPTPSVVCLVQLFVFLSKFLYQITAAVIVLTTIYSGVEYFMKNADVLAEAK